MLEPEGYFTSLSPIASEFAPLSVGLYRHIAVPAQHRRGIAPLLPRPPDLPGKTKLGSRNLFLCTLPPYREIPLPARRTTVRI
eukprot:13823831-Ditylum_brightwellii.AAC.1